MLGTQRLGRGKCHARLAVKLPPQNIDNRPTALTSTCSEKGGKARASNCKRSTATILVSVDRTEPFWARFGSVAEKVGVDLAENLEDHGENARTFHSRTAKDAARAVLM
jgi:hypothetical protein